MIQNGLKNFGMKQLAFYFVSSVVNESKGKKYLTKYLIYMASSFFIEYQYQYIQKNISNKQFSYI